MSERAGLQIAWETRHEIEFLNGIGRWSELGLTHGYLMDCYRIAMSKRENWEGVNKQVMEAHIRDGMDR